MSARRQPSRRVVVVVLTWTLLALYNHLGVGHASSLRERHQEPLRQSLPSPPPQLGERSSSPAVRQVGGLDANGLKQRQQQQQQQQQQRDHQKQHRPSAPGYTPRDASKRYPGPADIAATTSVARTSPSKRRSLPRSLAMCESFHNRVNRLSPVLLTYVLCIISISTVFITSIRCIITVFLLKTIRQQPAYLLPNWYL